MAARDRALSGVPGVDKTTLLKWILANRGVRGRFRMWKASAAAVPAYCPPQRRSGINDLTARDGMWRRFGGDDWAAFDALPAPVRRRLHEHAYDGWAVNALMLWRTFRRRHASTGRAVNTLLRYLDQCEDMERAAFAASHARSFGSPLPHVAAGASVLRYSRP